LKIEEDPKKALRKLFEAQKPPKQGEAEKGGQE
jgi:hypothetical protein